MEIRRFGFYWLDTWVMANIIQLSTQHFCLRHLNRTNDPCGRQFDQMTQAARSAPANIAERLAARTEKSLRVDAPACPLCGKPMIRRVAKKGINSGREFWSCSGYPECNGTRNIT